MYIYILPFILTFSIQGTISWLESYACTGSTPIIARLAGEIHDTDQANQKNVFLDSVKQYTQKIGKPLSIQIEDPLAIHGLEKLSEPKGLLLGITAQLQELRLPSHIEIKNFDTKKAANCAIHLFCQAAPKLTSFILDEICFGDLITELEQAHDLYCHHPVIENLGQVAKRDCVSQLTHIKTHLEILQKNLTELKFNASDSLALSATKITKESLNRHKIYDPLYQADVGLTSLAAIVTTLESKSDMALLCGERHAKDVGRILEHEQWQNLNGPYSFTDSWLLHSN